MAKMSPAKKKAFLRRMAAGRRRAASKGRRKNPMTAMSSRSPSALARRVRRRNPTSVAGIPVIPAAYEAIGAAAGGYFGGAATNFVSQQLVGKLPLNLQGIGFLIAGLGSIIGGKALKRKSVFGKLPIDTVGVALAIPMFLRAFEQWGFPGYGLTTTVTAVNTDTGTTEQVALGSMGGALAAGRLPGSMGGTINAGRLPGMAGSLYGRRGMSMGAPALRRVH